MIKRPLVWILLAYLLGMYLAWQGLPMIAAITIILIFYLLIYFFVYLIKNNLLSVKDQFLWILPFLLLLGFYSMKGRLQIPPLYGEFEQEISCELSGEISMIVRKPWGKALYVKNNTINLASDKDFICENVIIFCYDNQKDIIKKNPSVSSNYQVGNLITVSGTLQKFSEATNPGQFNEKQYYQTENIDFKMIADNIKLISSNYSIFQAYLDKVKNRLLLVYESILTKEEAGTLIAMLLGEKYLLGDEIKELYQVNGISHVLAISGLHVSLIGMAVFHLLKILRLPRIPATFSSIFIIYSYGIMTNFSVSTNRAVVMMVVMLLSGVIGKTYDMLSSLSLSALIILLQNPLQIQSAGFLLSFGAVLGIGLIFVELKKLFPSKNSFISSFFLSISAQITTTPIVLYFYYQYPLYGIITNLIILPFVTLLTLTSIIAGILGVIYLPLGIFLIGGASYILKFYEGICKIGKEMPYHLLTVGRPDMLRLSIYIIFLILFVWGVKRYKHKSFLICLGLAMVIVFLPRSNPGLEVTFLDVGQGDGIYMESDTGTTYLIDGGSSDVGKVGENRLIPFLLSKGKDCIDYAVITHSDSDHISGIREIIEGDKITVKNLILPKIAHKDEAYEALEALAMEEGVQLQYMEAGDALIDGDLYMYCLHPASAYRPTSINAYSTVLSITYGEFDMLLTGDLEKDGETLVTELLQNPLDWTGYDDLYHRKLVNVDYDILKVAHHGSKNSTSKEFLDLLRPEYAFISCSKDNWYGHPHPEVLKRLEEAGAGTYITYESGAITLRTQGRKLKLMQYLVDGE